MTLEKEVTFVSIPVEKLCPGDVVITCNGDTRRVRQVKHLKHPDWFRICFMDSTKAWERQRGQTVQVPWSPSPYYED